MGKMRSKRKAILKGLLIMKHVNILRNLPDAIPMNVLIRHRSNNYILHLKIFVISVIAHNIIL